MSDHKLKFLTKLGVGTLSAAIIAGGILPGVGHAQSTNNQISSIAKTYSQNLNEDSTSDDLMNVLKSLEVSTLTDSWSDSDKIELLEDILSEVPEDVLEQYQIDKMVEINGVLSNDLYVNSEIAQTIKLNDGSVVALSSTDEEDGDSGSVESIIPAKQGKSAGSIEMGPYISETKAYGNRLYTAWVKLKSLGVTVATLKLGNHYSVGTYGLKMRYADVAGTNGSALSDVSATAEVTDPKAEQVGYDMNAKGTYKLTGYLNNGYISLVSTIKLISWNKTNESVYVQQSYKYTD
ncbi:hypothetical protein [Bacillus sp. UNCCL81]|uniref:hypothetical protein n=1 Tax=Bacillus sp. UNCCL81 TaxID=1502755 RepID=UPI0008E82763|nr:hypothetical protein [Bacillus sp. UNCCL81]SFD61599.1 hypothetical protein SAMN02799633_04296 [Bacillus sp. UNCCL81]